MMENTQRDDAITLSAVGDLALHAQYDEMIADQAPDYFFSEVAPILRRSDVSFGNLESVLSTMGSPNPAKRLCLRGNLVFARGLSDAGFTVLSLANNHSFDFGTAAFQDMCSLLERNGIQWVGGGMNLAEARKPLVVECKGIKLLFLAYSAADTNGYNEADDDRPGVAPFDPALVIEDVTLNRDLADCIIVSLHWGEEFSHYPNPDQRTWARQIIDAGASIVLGHHSHVLQGIERYKEGVIAYNLGSLMMSGPSGDYRYELQDNNRESVILTFTITKEGVADVAITTTWLDSGLKSTICAGEKHRELMNKLDILSKKVASPDYPELWREMVIKDQFKSPLKEWLARGNFLRRIGNLRPSDIRRPFDFVSSYLKMRFKKL
ncbi:MAG: CapA family protein [Desulfuromonadales bacterium]|nr:MAG: CapA family protein [Desulfuromonadales bacterium]